MDATTEVVGDAADVREGVAEPATGEGEIGAVGTAQPANNTMVASQTVRGNDTPHRGTAPRWGQCGNSVLSMNFH